jgi:hypothetical protein
MLLTRFYQRPGGAVRVRLRAVNHTQLGPPEAAPTAGRQPRQPQQQPRRPQQPQQQQAQQAPLQGPVRLRPPPVRLRPGAES